MSVSAALAVMPPVTVVAPPVQRRAEPSASMVQTPRQLLTSLSAVPTVQRACSGCGDEDEESKMPVPQKVQRIEDADMGSGAEIMARKVLVQRKCASCGTDETPVMPRLELGPVDDTYEREADDIAGRVMAMRAPSPSMADATGSTGIGTASTNALQRKCAACSGNDDLMSVQPLRATLTVQRVPDSLLENDALRDLTDMPRMKATVAAGTEQIEASAGQLTSGGSALAPSTRDFFESRMGRDLSDVRIHKGPSSDTLNHSIAARAFTFRNHIWLGGSESEGPSFTMAHEMAHVLQQTQPGAASLNARRRLNRYSAANGGGAVVQRRENAFWLPTKTLSAAKLHKTMHDRAIEEIGKANSSILSEVPIPGANRKLVDVGAKGRADIYTAKADPEIMVPGVKEVAANVPATVAQDTNGPNQPAGSSLVPASINLLGNFKPTMIEKMKQGKSVIPHSGRRAPKIAAGKLTDIGSAPTNIRIGEMKPAHDMDYRKSGAKQIANYIAGITATANTVNNVAQAAGQNHQWLPNAKVIDGTSLIPSGWDARLPHTDWPFPSIKIRHYKHTKAKTKSGKRKIKAANSRQGRPVSQAIRGRWMMAPDNESGHEGVFVYFLAPEPTDLAAALGTASTRTNFRLLSTKLEKIKHDLVVPPKPVAGSGTKVQPRRLPTQTPLPTVLRAPARPVRKEVKDDFKAAAWEKARTGAGLKSKETHNSLLGDYGATDNDLREDIAEKGAMAEWLKTKPKTKGTTYKDKVEYASLLSDLKLMKGVDFWTGIKARPFGILREKFGFFFVKAYEKATGFADKIRKKFKSFKEKDILAGKSGTIRKAAAKVASVVLPRLAKPFMAKMFDTIIECGIKGFEAKFRELIEGTFIEDVIQTAEQLESKVEKLATDVEAYFKDLIDKTMKPITADFNKFVNEAKLLLEVVNIVKEITTALRIGSCVAGLASAPGTVGFGAAIGCGAALGDYILGKFGLSPVEHLIGTILSSCDMQNEVGKLMAKVQFIKTLPKRAGTAIIVKVKSLLKDNKALKGLGSVKGKDFGQHASELFCNPANMKFPNMGYETDNCSTTPKYRRSKIGEYKIPPHIGLYKRQNPVPVSEIPWMGTEIPPGRANELNAMPPDPSKKATVGSAPGVGANRSGSSSLLILDDPEVADSISGERADWVGTMTIVGGFDLDKPPAKNSRVDVRVRIKFSGVLITMNQQIVFLQVLKIKKRRYVRFYLPPKIKGPSDAKIGPYKLDQGRKFNFNRGSSAKVDAPVKGQK